MTPRLAAARLLGAAALVLAMGAQAAEGAATEPMPIASLQALDKVTARVTALEAMVGEPVRFGTLEVLVLACYRSAPEDPPESAAFLSIRELRPYDPMSEIFSGWMFASSPGLSALEHPVYDIWVTECHAPLAAEPEAVTEGAAEPPPETGPEEPLEDLGD